MKKIITLFSTLLAVALISGHLKAQPTCSWAKKAGGTNEDYGSSVATDNFGNVYYLGNFYSQKIVFGTTTLNNQPYQAFNYGSEMFLTKYDSCGNFKWAVSAGGNSGTTGKRLVTDPAGNIYVCGYSNADTVYFGTVKLINKAGYGIAFVVKYNSSGVAQWAQQGSGYNGTARGYAIALDASNNILLTGNFYSSAIKFGADSALNEYNNGDGSVFIAKFDNAGTIQWVKSGGGDYDCFAYGIGTDASGNVYVGGTYGSTHIRFGNDSLPLSPSGYYDIFVVKYSSIGTEQWLRVAGSSDDDEAMSLASDAAGNVYITGFIGYVSTVTFGTHAITNTTHSLSMFIAKYDASGTAQWAKIGQGNGYTNNQGYNVKLDANGDPNIIGFYSSDSLQLGAVSLINNSMLTGGGDTVQDIFVAKYKANGVLSWARTAGGISHDWGYGLALGAHNSIYITGEFMSPTISFPGVPTLSLTPGSAWGNGDAFITNNISLNLDTPRICMVTVDSLLAKNNLIAWDKTQFQNADSIIIYREIGTGNYKPIASVPSTALSLFTDTVKTKYFPNTGDPNSGTYRYKIGFRDTAGNYSVLSPFHNTIFITNSNGTFSWAQLYTIENSANPVSSYVLMRDDSSNGKWHAIASVAGTQQQASDPMYPTYQNIASWRVETQWSISCPITIHKGPDEWTSNLNLSKSNVNRIAGNGVSEIGNAIPLEVYPNPTAGKFMVEWKGTKAELEISNLLGENVLRSDIKNQRSEVDMSSSPNGVYFIKLKTEQGVAVRKVIKE